MASRTISLSSALTTIALLLAGHTGVSAQRYHEQQHSGTRIVSPAVLATWVASQASDGTPKLDLLVLWRGTTAWFTKKGHASEQRASGQTSSGISTITLQRGGVELTVLFDRNLQLVRIQDKEFALSNGNVILVDDVDSSGGIKIVGTRNVDPQLSDPSRIEPIFRNSPELVEYLRCDAALHDVPDVEREILGRVCAALIGK